VQLWDRNLANFRFGHTDSTQRCLVNLLKHVDQVGALPILIPLFHHDRQVCLISLLFDLGESLSWNLILLGDKCVRLRLIVPFDLLGGLYALHLCVTRGLLPLFSSEFSRSKQLLPCLQLFRLLLVKPLLLSVLQSFFSILLSLLAEILDLNLL